MDTGSSTEEMTIMKDIHHAETGPVALWGSSMSERCSTVQRPAIIDCSTQAGLGKTKGIVHCRIFIGHL